jgi:hypothetical protein
MLCAAVMKHSEQLHTTQEEELPTTTHGRIDKGILKLNLWREAQQFQQQLQRHLKMTNVGRNM